MVDDFFVHDTDGGLLSPGEMFHGCEVREKLGVGASGEVYLVRHMMLDSLFALKLRRAPETTVGDEPVKRFMREAKIAARIQHPNLVRVHDAGYDEAKSAYYLVMDYVSGGTLRERIGFGGPLSPGEALEIVRQVASALDAGSYFGVVHRDIKPENILFTEDGRVKLVDLGIAKMRTDDSLSTSTGKTFGTPAYMAPEQALDASSVDARADIYSLGIVLFEMLSGRLPFAGETMQAIVAQALSDDPIPDIRRLNPCISNWMSALLFRMCAKDREKRIPTPARLLAEISARVGGAGVGKPDLAEYMAVESSAPVRKENSPEEDAEIDAFIAEKHRLRKMSQRRTAVVWGLVAALSILGLILLAL